MSTAPSPEIWDNILKDNVEKDDPLWTEYLDKAAVFDVRMVDEWNKIVDVLLVCVALFISVLTSFIARTTQFKRDPADITNDLLVAIYTHWQLAAQSNNTSIPPVDPRSYFNQSQADYDVAVSQNALLYVSLSLSIIVSVIALAAKLWLVSYSQQAFSVGSPYDRAMKRQEAYNGILVWNMGGVINMLPVILLIALYLFGIYVYSSVQAVQVGIADAVGALLGSGLMFLSFTSLAAAIKGSDIIKPDPCGYLVEVLLLLMFGSVILSLVLGVGLLRIVSIIPLLWISLFLLIFTIPFAVPAHWGWQLFKRHRPQKYKIPYVAAPAFFTISVWVISFRYFQFSYMYVIGMAILATVYAMFCAMSKSMVDTGEIDAIAWLLITTPQYPATFFKKAAQMTGANSIGRHYRPRLLESLMPLLSPLITSYHTPEHHNSDTHSPESDDVLNDRLRTNLDEHMDSIDEDPHLKNLEIYVSCLARLSEFTDYTGQFYRLWEDARQHSKLEQPLIDKLVELASPHRQSLVGLRSAATKVLNNYEFDMEGNPLRSPTTVLENVVTDLRQEATSMSKDNGSSLNSREQGHSGLYGPSTHIEPATHVGRGSSAATSIFYDSGLNSQEQGHSELYRPAEDGQWTTVERRRARSLDSPGRVSKNSSDSKNSNRRLTTDQAQTVEAAANNLTEHQKNSISRRQKMSVYRKSYLSSRGEAREGLSKSEGKNIDPREWGQVNISLESLDSDSDIEAQKFALNSIAQAKNMTIHRKDEYYEERNPSATRCRSRQASRPAESRPAAQIAEDSYLSPALNEESDSVKDPSTRIEPATHVEPSSAATSISNESGLNGRERGQSESELYRPEDPATRVEPVSAATWMFNDSELDSQEQGLQKLYRPVNPATRVESEECEIGDEKIEEVKSQVGDEEIEA